MKKILLLSIAILAIGCEKEETIEDSLPCECETFLAKDFSANKIREVELLE